MNNCFGNSRADFSAWEAEQLFVRSCIMKNFIVQLVISSDAQIKGGN
jgi:hypothetical protein